MKYTMSKDGKERANVRIEVRLTREDIQFLERAATNSGVEIQEFMRLMFGVRLGQLIDETKKTETK